MDLDFHRSPEVLERIVDNLVAGLFTVDAQGRFVAWNRGAELITGYAAADLIGQPCSALDGPNCEGFGALAQLLSEPASANGSMCQQDCKILGGEGTDVYLHGSVQILRDPSGVVQGAVGCFMDVTSLVYANEKIAVLERQTSTGFTFEQLIGNSAVMREVYRKLRLASDSEVTVLLTGESGTGKELAARAIHNQSDRRQKAFMAVNCSAIPESLLESELFGHVKGAFTGAAADHLGLFEAANGGTLFLDEIGDVSPAIQVKLLRVLQEREVRRVGDTRSRPVDVRLITATHRDLMQLVNTERVREDFYYRIHVFEINLPALRERKDDIPLLVDSFLKDAVTNRSGGQVTAVARDALDALSKYHWPGNVRELRNAIEYASVTAVSEKITYFDLPPEVRGVAETRQLNAAGLSPDQHAEKVRIEEALRQTGGNRTKAADLLGTSRVTFWKKISRYGLDG